MNHQKTFIQHELPMCYHVRLAQK